MRILATLLIAVSAVATAKAQSSSTYPGQHYGQTQVYQSRGYAAPAQTQTHQNQQVPRNHYSNNGYARSVYPPRARYTRSTYPPGYAPAHSYYAYPQQSYPNLYGQNTHYGYQPGQSYATTTPQVQQPQFGAGFGSTFTDQTQQQARPHSQVVVGQTQVQQPQFGAGFGPTFTDQVQQVTQTNAHRQKEAAQRQERWRQYQRQQAYIQQYGDARSQQFWQNIYGYNRSFHNQGQHGYAFHGQSRIGQNLNGYSTYNQSRSGQGFSNPGFHAQSRFNQSQPIYSFHNIVVPYAAGHWRR